MLADQPIDSAEEKERKSVEREMCGEQRIPGSNVVMS